ncbi:DUF3438 family protein [Photobacterium phosphoreum]|uniref:DUF3438 family protein n=1 Tax=Photobacterium phosphoreum TaxID=659 RepID=UPI0015E6BB63|nr:DUF3438 family protein [Photobacterium phosphoreum]
MRKNILNLVVSSLIACASLQASATEVLKWNGTPLDINLKPNQERIIRLPDNTMFRIPTELKSVLHVNSAAGVLYLKADSAMKNVPVEAMLASTGEVIKMNINSNDKEKNTDDEIRIVLPWEKTNTAQLASSGSMPNNVLPSETMQDATVSVSNNDSEVQPAVTPNELIRYAAMRDFMPSRLWVKNSQIEQLPNANHINLTGLFYGQSTGVFDAHIEDSYRAGDMNLYVITLKNKMPFAVDIRFDDIAINFAYASVPEPYYALGALGTNNDFSYLYLITKDNIKTLMTNVDPSAGE